MSTSLRRLRATDSMELSNDELTYSMQGSISSANLKAELEKLEDEARAAAIKPPQLGGTNASLRAGNRRKARNDKDRAEADGPRRGTGTFGVGFTDSTIADDESQLEEAMRLAAAARAKPQQRQRRVSIEARLEELNQPKPAPTSQRSFGRMASHNTLRRTDSTAGSTSRLLSFRSTRRSSIGNDATDEKNIKRHLAARAATRSRRHVHLSELEAAEGELRELLHDDANLVATSADDGQLTHMQRMRRALQQRNEGHLAGAGVAYAGMSAAEMAASKRAARVANEARAAREQAEQERADDEYAAMRAALRADVLYDVFGDTVVNAVPLLTANSDPIHVEDFPVLEAPSLDALLGDREGAELFAELVQREHALADVEAQRAQLQAQHERELEEQRRIVTRVRELRQPEERRRAEAARLAASTVADSDDDAVDEDAFIAASPQRMARLRSKLNDVSASIDTQPSMCSLPVAVAELRDLREQIAIEEAHVSAAERDQADRDALVRDASQAVGSPLFGTAHHTSGSFSSSNYDDSSTCYDDTWEPPVLPKRRPVTTTTTAATAPRGSDGTVVVHTASATPTASRHPSDHNELRPRGDALEASTGAVADDGVKRRYPLPNAEQPAPIDRVYAQKGYVSAMLARIDEVRTQRDCAQAELNFLRHGEAEAVCD